MAWEEESIESGVDFDDGGGKKSIVKMAIIALLVIGLGVAGWFAYTKFLAGDDSEEAVENGEGTQSEETAESQPPPETGFKVDLEKFTLNLSGGGSSRYLVCTIALEVTTEELKALLDESENSLAMAKTRDAIIQIMRAKTVEEVRDPAALREIGNEIKFKLSRLYTEGDVMNVYFSEFLID